MVVLEEQVLGLRKGRLHRLGVALMLSVVVNVGDMRSRDLPQFRKGPRRCREKRVRTDALELEGEHETLSTVL